MILTSILLQMVQPADSAASLSAPAEKAVETMTFWDLAVKGGPILIPIAILSLMAVYIFFERFFTIQKFSKTGSNFMNQIRDNVHHGNIEAAKVLCRNTNSPVARMVQKGLMRLGKPVHDIEGAIENVGKLEVYNMEKNLGLLSSIAGLAPMFGFLGTIFGVIKIFYEIHLENSLEIGTISGGLYMKMIASAAGLLVGIIAYAGYQYLIHRIDRVVHQMELNAVEFMDMLEDPVKSH